MSVYFKQFLWTIYDNQTMTIMNCIIYVNICIKLMTLVCSMLTFLHLKRSSAVCNSILVLKLCLKHGLLIEKTKSIQRKDVYQN